ncbi:Hypothetical protein (Fragment) [Durusdinium trenchii]|uniref:Uncharacterized protein n=1 Tax=Durusdinium trenchii TaxID=1381693 RepID=A0ABP0N046_9DINO
MDTAHCGTDESQQQEHHCAICQLSWTGPPGSWSVHAAGKTHRKRLLNPRKPCTGPLPSVDHSTSPRWAQLPSGTIGARDPPAALVVQFWPWPESESGSGETTFNQLAERFVANLCQPDPGLSSLERAQKTRDVQDQMRRCEQQPEHFEDVEALWGYAKEKFVLRSSMAFNALRSFAPDQLKQRMGGSLRVAAMGGGPAAELFAAAVSRDLLGGRPGTLAVYEWVPTWNPIVQAVAQLLGEEISYHHCDVSKPLADDANEALREAAYDLIIFSHVLLESGRGGGEAPLELLQDLWESQDCFMLVLDAGQARGKQKRLRPLAGSLRQVEALAQRLHPIAQTIRIDGSSRTDGVFLSRAEEEKSTGRMSG